MKKQGVMMAVWIVIAILLVIGILVFYLANKEAEKPLNPDEKPELINKVIKNNFNSGLINDTNAGGNPVNKNQILGKWNGVYEEFLDARNDELGNYSLNFKSDGTYEYIKNGISETGDFNIVEDKINFYNKDSKTDQPASYDMAYAKFEGKNLKLTFPKFPKVVVFEKT